jgi:hypothetical protein
MAPVLYIFMETLFTRKRLPVKGKWVLPGCLVDKMNDDGNAVNKRTSRESDLKNKVKYTYKKL